MELICFSVSTIKFVELVVLVKCCVYTFWADGSRIWKLGSINPPINKPSATWNLPVTSVCACDMYKSWQLIKAELSGSGLKGSL